MNRNVITFWSIIEPFKREYFVVVIVAIFAAIFESLGYYSLMPMLDIMLGKSSKEYQLFGQAINIKKLSIFPENIVLGLGVLVIFIFLLRFSLTIIRIYTTQKLNWDLRNYYTEKLANLYTNSTTTYLNSQKHGIILNNSLNETNRAAAAITALIEIFSKASIIIVLYISLFVTQLKVTLIISALALIIWIIIRKYISRFSENIGTKRLLKSQQMMTLASENFSAIRNSKIFNVQKTNINRFKTKLIEYSKILLKYNVVLGIPTPAIEFLFVFSFIMLIIFFSVSGEMRSIDISVMTIYFVICQRIFQYSSFLINQRVKFLSLLPSLRLINDLVRENIPQEKLKKGNTINKINKDIIFNNVSFNYEKDKKVLNDLNFKIRYNQITSVFGESGIGKSTIADLILRLHSPSSGKITIGDQNISDYSLYDWRDKIGYVSQDSFFYNTSVYDNLIIGRVGIKKSDVIGMCKFVNAHSFISQAL